MEEFVGKIWHKMVTRAAIREYPEAAVTLSEVSTTIGIFFRALGGEGGLRVEPAIASAHGARRRWIARIAGTGQQVELAWRDDETLRLPSRIALFPARTLNHDLYLWLAATAATETDIHDDWFQRNCVQAATVLRRYPGLRSRYRRIVAAHLKQRPALDTLPANEAAQERAIQRALSDPETALSPLPGAHKPPQPVPLWLHPSPPIVTDKSVPMNADSDESAMPEGDSKTLKNDRRRKGERTSMPNGKDGLLAFRLESLFSWTEYVKVDRTMDEGDEDNAAAVADDLDALAMARDNSSVASRLRFDLDLPPEENDDIYLGEGIPLPEWDFKKQQLQADHCRLQPLVARNVEQSGLPPHLRLKAKKLRSQFEALTPDRIWFHGQKDGVELDLDAYISHTTEQRIGCQMFEPRMYRDVRNASRNLACLLLADLSLSTDTWVNNDARVIDVIRDTLFLFSEALSATGDRFGLYGFSSRRRSHVRFHVLKDFSETYSPMIRSRIHAIKPGYYTRMGAAVRYATTQLAATPATQKILLLLTDGKPNDLDKYEGRYGIEDTRMAILEAKKQGLQPFCVTIDEKAQGYLPYIFGSGAYVLIRKVEELPRKLPLLYMRLTR